MGEPQELTTKASLGALYEILDRLKKSDSSVAEMWVQILDANWQTPEFALRHAEVVGLFSDAMIEIGNLNPESVSKRFHKYTSSWWHAIVGPTQVWDHTVASFIISDSDLDQLATASDLVVAQLGGSLLVPAVSDLALLREECEGWASLVAVSDEITDQSFRQTLLAQINHLIWLIDNAATFGLPRIVQRGDQVTGTLIRATVRQGTIKNSSGIRDRISKFITVLTLVANLIHSSQIISDTVDHALPGAEKLIRELTSGNSGNETDNRVQPRNGDALS